MKKDKNFMMMMKAVRDHGKGMTVQERVIDRINIEKALGTPKEMKKYCRKISKEQPPTLNI